MSRTANSTSLAADRYIDRAEALGRLGIKAQTLYAYVSRGWIRSIRQPHGGKLSLYSSDDIEKVKARSSARTSHGVAAAGAMRWGEPIMPTSITEITTDGQRYRGRSAVAMARNGAAFEAVAELLWTGMWFDGRITWPVTEFPKGLRELVKHLPQQDAKDRLLDIFAMSSLYLGMSRGTASQQMQTAAPTEAARELIQVMVGSTGYLGGTGRLESMRQGESVAQALLRILGAPVTGPAQERALNAVLVLLADHELTGSTFAARIAASSGTFLHGCITAALTTHSGLYIARIHDRVESLVAECRDPAEMMARLREAQGTGDSPPGFNHPLYPHGDPRAECLLAIAAEVAPRSKKVAQLLKWLDAARTQLHLHPRVEMGVVAICCALRLPAKSPSALFAIARSSGWVAHILEQRTAGFLVRPRAKYMSTEV